MKVAELQGAQLDYWVARAGEVWKTAHQHFPTMTLDPTFSGVELRNYPRGEFGASILTCVLIPRNPFRQGPQPFCPSIAWEHGGPIIERERITIKSREDEAGWLDWCAYVGANPVNALTFYGPTPLIAAMRAYVSSKFGAEVHDKEPR